MMKRFFVIALFVLGFGPVSYTHLIKGNVFFGREDTSIDIALYVGKNDHSKKCGSAVGEIRRTGVITFQYRKTYELCQCIIFCFEEIR